MTRPVGVDAARAVALVGMFATHTLDRYEADGSESVTAQVAEGRSAALFAVVAGVGIALSAGATERPGTGRSHLAAGVGLLVRGLLIGLIGLVLADLGPPVAVILAYYGLMFVLAIPLLRLPAAGLAAVAVLACVAVPVLSHVVRAGLPEPGGIPGIESLADPGALIADLALTGVYPALPWMTYLLAGMALGRLDLRRAVTAARLLAGGVVLAVLASVLSAVLVGRSGLDPVAAAETRFGTTPLDSWWWLVVDAPHSGTPFDLAHTTGTALAVLGALLLAARVPLLTWVPAAVGAIPLTLYTLHVVLLELVATRPGADLSGQLLPHILGAVLLGVLLRATGLRGPLEWLVSRCSRAARDAVGDRGRAAADP